jgi:hypothetical protein
MQLTNVSRCTQDSFVNNGWSHTAQVVVVQPFVAQRPLIGRLPDCLVIIRTLFVSGPAASFTFRLINVEAAALCHATTFLSPCLYAL